MGRGTRTLGGSRDRENCNYGFVETNCTTEPCCSLLPCSICVTYTFETGEKSNAEILKTSEDGYAGRIIKQPITLQWVKDSYDVCRFVITLDGIVLVSLEKCTEEQCKSPSGVYNFPNGDAIEWSTYLKPRRKVRAQNAPCVDVPCFDCKCLCERLCILWRRDDGYGTNLACTGYGCVSDCDSVLIEAVLESDCITGDVLWGPAIFEPVCLTNPVGTVSVYVILREADEYGSCELALFVDGEERATVSIPGAVAEQVCKDVSIGASYEDEDGCIVTVTVECKKCGDPCFSSGDTCKKGCCFTDINCATSQIDEIPFRIDGGPLDGTTSYFERATPTGQGACGTCGFVESPLIYPLQGWKCDEVSTVPTNCSSQIVFAIVCENGHLGDSEVTDFYEAEGEECGNRARLIVGILINNFAPESAFDNPEFNDQFFGVFHAPVAPFAILDINVNCNLEGMQGTIDLSEISMKDCYAGSGSSDPPDCPGGLPAGCCDLFESFEGVSITLLPHSELSK